MPFLAINSDTFLNIDWIERIDLNHTCPSTQERCIRLELRALPGADESRILLLHYSPEWVAALVEALNLRPELEVTQPCNSPSSFVTLFSEGWDKPIQNYVVARVPCVGEYLIIHDHERSIFNTFQVEKVCHLTPGDASSGTPFQPSSSNEGPDVLLLLVPCVFPFPPYSQTAA